MAVPSVGGRYLGDLGAGAYLCQFVRRQLDRVRVARRARDIQRDHAPGHELSVGDLGDVAVMVPTAPVAATGAGSGVGVGAVGPSESQALTLMATPPRIAMAE